ARVYRHALLVLVATMLSLVCVLNPAPFSLLRSCVVLFLFVFFFNATATTEIYTLSLHDALPICIGVDDGRVRWRWRMPPSETALDRKSTRLNSSHVKISYAVFCLKKKKKQKYTKNQRTPQSATTRNKALDSTHNRRKAGPHLVEK